MADQNCELFRDQFLEMLAMGNGPTADSSQAMAHLRVCESCKNHAAELMSDFATVAEGTPTTQVPADFEDRVFGGITAHKSTPQHIESNEEATKNLADDSGANSQSPRLTTFQRRASYLLAAALLFLVVGGQWLYIKRIERVTLASRDPSADERTASLETAVAEMQSLQQRAQRAEVRFVSFQPDDRLPVAGAKPTIAAHAIWDSLTSEVHFFGFDMNHLSGKERYALWVESDGNRQLLTSFNAEPDGTAKALAVARDESGQLTDHVSKIMVSVEKLPIGEQPAGEIWFRANMER